MAVLDHMTSKWQSWDLNVDPLDIVISKNNKPWDPPGFPASGLKHPEGQWGAEPKFEFRSTGLKSYIPGLPWQFSG